MIPLSGWILLCYIEDHMFGDVHNTRTLRPHVVFDRPFQPFLGLSVDLLRL